MSEKPSKFFKLSTVLWSLGLSVCFVIFVGSMLLPSTKRASPRTAEYWERKDREELERNRELARQAATQSAATAAELEAQRLARNPNPVWRTANDLFGSTRTRPSTQPATRTLLLPGTKFGVISPPSTHYSPSTSPSSTPP